MYEIKATFALVFLRHEVFGVFNLLYISESQARVKR
jgi:hypothetical protein